MPMHAMSTRVAAVLVNGRVSRPPPPREGQPRFHERALARCDQHISSSSASGYFDGAPAATSALFREMRDVMYRRAQKAQSSSAADAVPSAASGAPRRCRRSRGPTRAVPRVLTCAASRRVARTSVSAAAATPVAGVPRAPRHPFRWRNRWADGKSKAAIGREEARAPRNPALRRGRHRVALYASSARAASQLACGGARRCVRRGVPRLGGAAPRFTMVAVADAQRGAGSRGSLLGDLARRGRAAGVHARRVPGRVKVLAHARSRAGRARRGRRRARRCCAQHAALTLLDARRAAPSRIREARRSSWTSASGPMTRATTRTPQQHRCPSCGACQRAARVPSAPGATRARAPPPPRRRAPRRDARRDRARRDTAPRGSGALTASLDAAAPSRGASGRPSRRPWPATIVELATGIASAASLPRVRAARRGRRRRGARALAAGRRRARRRRPRVPARGAVARAARAGPAVPAPRGRGARRLRRRVRAVRLRDHGPLGLLRPRGSDLRGRPKRRGAPPASGRARRRVPVRRTPLAAALDEAAALNRTTPRRWTRSSSAAGPASCA